MNNFCLLLSLGLIGLSITACNSVLQDYKYCQKHDLPSFWQNYDLPKVEGSVVCSDFEGTPGKERVILLHYNDGKKGDGDFIDYYKPYEAAFRQNGWELQRPFHDNIHTSYYGIKNGDIFYIEFTDCYLGQKTYGERPCSKVEISHTDKVPPPPKKSL